MSITIDMPDLTGSRHSANVLFDACEVSLDHEDIVVDASRALASSLSFWQQVCHRAFVEANASSVTIWHPTQRMTQQILRWMPEDFSAKVTVVPREQC